MVRGRFEGRFGGFHPTGPAPSSAATQGTMGSSSNPYRLAVRRHTMATADTVLCREILHPRHTRTPPAESIAFRRFGRQRRLCGRQIGLRTAPSGPALRHPERASVRSTVPHRFGPPRPRRFHAFGVGRRPTMRVFFPGPMSNSYPNLVAWSWCWRRCRTRSWCRRWRRLGAGAGMTTRCRGAEEVVVVGVEDRTGPNRPAHGGRRR